MDFADEWKLVKKNFENATAKKKPSGEVSKGTGIEAAAKAMDDALKKKDANAAIKARNAFASAQKSYIAVLAKAAVGEKDRDVAGELKVMIGELLELDKKMGVAADDLDFDKHAEKAKFAAWEGIRDLLPASPLLKKTDLVKSFSEKPEFGFNQATMVKDPKLVSTQSQLKQSIAKYATLIAAFKGFDPRKGGGDAARQKLFVGMIRDANDALNVGGGAMDILGEWRLINGNNLKSDAAARKQFEASKMRKVIDDLNEALSEENMRLGQLEMAFEKQVQRSR